MSASASIHSMAGWELQLRGRTAKRIQTRMKAACRHRQTHIHRFNVHFSGRLGSACILFSPPHFWTCGSSWDRPKLFICFKTPSITSSSGHPSLTPSSYVVVQRLIQSVSFLHSKLPSSWDRQTDRKTDRLRERHRERQRQSLVQSCTDAPIDSL